MAAAPVLPASPAPTPEPAPLSEGARIIDTFIAPSKTFTDLRRSAAWWGPWLLISIVSLLFVYAMDRQIGFEQIIKSGISRSARADQFDKLPADRQAKQIQTITTFTRTLAYASPVLTLLYIAVAALVLMVTLNLVAGAGARFPTSFAVVAYAFLPGVVGAILGITSMFAGINPEGFNANNPMATNPAYFMDPASNKFLYGMVSALDVISIWTIVLLGIGFACTSKVKRSTAIIVVTVWYLLWKVGSAGLASLS